MTIMLLEWIFTSMFLILVVLALRAALGKRVSAGLRYALWAAVLLRLLVPVQLFTSPIAGTWVFSETRVEQNVTGVPTPPQAPPTAPAGESVGLPVPDVAGNVPGVPEAPTLPDAPEPPAAPDLTRVSAWLGWIWLAGAGLTALVLLLSNGRFYWRLRRERTPLEEADCPLRVYAAVDLPSPCLFGIVRPAIYVTPQAAVDPAMLRHVLAHEYTHYKHGDHLWSLLRCAALAVHWWNPLVWLAVVLSQRDGELACDEGALKRLGDGQRAAYGSTLLALVTAKPSPGDLFRCATTMAGDKKSLKERITRIAQAPRRWLWAAVMVVLVTALACVCAFGQAEPSDDVGEFTPTYTMGGERMVLVEGLGSAHVVWSRGTNGGSLYLAEDLGRLCPRLAGETSEGGADWEDAEKSVLHVGLNVNDDRLMDGTVNGFRIGFTVDLSSDTVVQKEFTSQLGDRTIKLTDREMLDMARILAEVLTGAADYYNAHSAEYSAGDPADLLLHFTMNVGNVPMEVLGSIGQDVRGKYEQFLLDLDSQPIAAGNSGKPEFNNWRVKSLEGPWNRTVLGMDLEIWRVFTEYHTPEPEKAKFMLAGGMYVTEDGWYTPADWKDYYIFRLDQQGGRSLAAIMPMGGGGGAPDGETLYLRDSFDEMLERTLAGAQAVDPEGLTPDLNRNGIPEELRVVSLDGGAGQKLEVWEGGELIYEEEGYFAHAGYNALFLYHDEDGDYLLRYNPYMAQGWATYSCRLFTLYEHGASTARYADLEFDLNFHPMMRSQHKFDVNEITGFMSEINQLLSHSVQLINTDQDLLKTFEKNGWLYDDLGWLDGWEPAYTRTGGALPDQLWAFQRAMEGEWYENEPVLAQVNEEPVDAVFDLRYQDKSTRFTVDFWDPRFDPQPQVLDLNGDGRDEIAFKLVKGSGTGCFVEDLLVFDADTLEQYDTSDLSERILGSIQSTGDGENFYLRGPGLDEAIPKSAAEKENPGAPVAQALGLGEIVRWTVKDGKVFCWLGCDASGRTTNYIGWVNAPVNMSPSGAFSCGNAQYVDGPEGPFE